MKQWLSVEEISEELGIDVQTVRLWIRTKRLPAYKPGKNYMVKREDLQKFLDDSKTIQDDKE